jgi:AcrR family transcriptional regulator
MIQERGVASCSMRALASELGVQPPALYRRVRDKDELLSLVLADAFGEVRVPAAGTWQERIAEVMRRMRRLVRRQPHLLDLYLRSHLRDSDVTRLSIRGSAPLRDAGFSAEAAMFALTVLSMYTLGMASVAASLDIDDEAMFEFGLTRMIEGLTPGET